MGVNIHIKPSDIWEFFEQNLSRLKSEMVAIAENEETKQLIYITEHNNCPLFSAYEGAVKLYEECVVSEDDCLETVKHIYLKYLFPVVVHQFQCADIEDLEEEEFATEVEIQAIEDEIYEREDTLFLATTDFLEILLNCDGHNEITALYGGNIINELIDSFCTVLAEDYAISVFRPTWITDVETGVENHIEYPYLEAEESLNGWHTP